MPRFRTTLRRKSVSGSVNQEAPAPSAAQQQNGNPLRKSLVRGNGSSSASAAQKEALDALKRRQQNKSIMKAQTLAAKTQAAEQVAFSKLENDLLFAAAEGDSSRIATLSKLVDVNCVDDFSMTPLHVAAFNGRADACLELIKSGADLGAVDEWGRNAMHQAASNGHTATIITLLASGASHLMSEQDMEGGTPLHLAAENDHSDAVLALVEAGADVNLYDWWSKTPLLLAAESGHAKTLQTLVKSGAQLDAVDDWGRTALHLAVECNSISAVGALLDGRGANQGLELVNVMDKSSYTPYMLAVDSQLSKVAELIKSRATKAGKKLITDVAGGTGKPKGKGGKTTKEEQAANDTKVQRSKVDGNRKKMKKQRQATLERIVNARKVTTVPAGLDEHSATWTEDKKLIDENYGEFQKILKGHKWVALMLRTDVLDYYLSHPKASADRTKM
jgi:ankyrin repeat protein